MIKGNLALERSFVPVRRASISSSMISASIQKVKSRIKSLAEAVILQAIEDLFDPSERKKSIDFLRVIISPNALKPLSTLEQMRIIRMLPDPGFKQSPFEKEKGRGIFGT